MRIEVRNKFSPDLLFRLVAYFESGKQEGRLCANSVPPPISSFFILRPGGTDLRTFSL